MRLLLNRIPVPLPDPPRDPGAVAGRDLQIVLSPRQTYSGSMYSSILTLSGTSAGSSAAEAPGANDSSGFGEAPELVLPHALFFCSGVYGVMNSCLSP